jgi:hypothetical protein
MKVTGLVLLLATLPLVAEPRKWSNTDGTSSFMGEYVSHTGTHVTIRRDDSKEFTIEKSKLHPDDLAWIDGLEKAAEAPDSTGAFDTLRFGDDRKTVQRKLLASKFVECSVDSTFLGRTGLNGCFRTREKIGGAPCDLWFQWDANGGLTQIMLQTQPTPAATYDTTVKESWKALSTLMTELHGKPLQAAAYPDSGELTDGAFLGSHLWRLETGGSAMLGTACQDGKYLASVHFTSERLEPVRQ